MYEISKAFDFCYGHRVWNQDLKQEYAGRMESRCKHLHGHQGRVVVFLEATDLSNGMVTDFNHLNWFKQFIDENIDHKFVIDRHDPIFGYMMGALNDENDEQLEKEYDDSFYTVDFVPTSENLAKWVFDLVQEKMKPLGVTVAKVEWCETPKSCSVYKAK